MVDINAFQAEVKKLSQHLDTKSPEQRILYLISELGEVVDEVLELQNIDPNAADINVDKIKERIGLEIYDVIWNAVDLANMLDIDLQAAFDKKIAINKERKWSRSGYIDKNQNESSS